MKTKPFFALALLMLPSILGYAQNNEFQEVTALKLQEELIQGFLDDPQPEVFTLDKKGVLRPAKSYHIVYNKSKKILLLKPKDQPLSHDFSTGKYDEVELPGGHKATCFCLEGYDNCRFEKSNDPQTPNRWVCLGSCGCGIGIIFNNVNFPLQYQTPGGGWFNF
ncbi:MAG: hypothetical protein KDC34_01555 [Saprospiraceae bacterium]|nr:hypothetical protein [Saprospiraceae bacterium]